MLLCTVGKYRLTPTISAPRHPTKPENTKPLRGAGALDRDVRPVCWLEMLGFVPHPKLRWL